MTDPTLDSAAEAPPEIPPDLHFPSPRDCARSANITGVPVTLADGNEWLLARDGLRRLPARYRDQLYDDVMINSTVAVSTARAAAYLLLRANYELDEPDALALILHAEPANFTDAVIDAVLSSEPEVKTWTAWARASLIANGIDPASVAPDDLPAVLYNLTLMKLAIPHEEWTDSGRFEARQSHLRTIWGAYREKSATVADPAQAAAEEGA